jgi:hypothetical protein
MTTFVVECPKCWRSRWSATGRFNENRHGLKRAECVCASCGYVFSSGRPEAIAAGEAVSRAPVVETPLQQPSLPHSKVTQPSGFTKVGTLAKDFKRRQAGEDVA